MSGGLVIHSPKPGEGEKSSLHEADLAWLRQQFPSARSSPVVVATDRTGWKHGIRPGMPLAEARSMASPLQPLQEARTKKQPPADKVELTIREWTPFTDRETLAADAELLRPFAPVIAIPDVCVPDCLILDVTGCGALFGGESALAEQLLHRLAQHNRSAHLVISDNTACAWAFAHPNGPEIAAAASHYAPDEFQTPVTIIPPGQAPGWFEHLPTEAARLARSDVDILRQLGILTLRQLVQLPIEDLPSRLSDEAITRVRQLTGVTEELLEPIPEATPVTASWVNEFPVSGLKPLQMIAEQLIDDVCQQLRRRHVGTIRLDFSLRPEEGDILELSVEVVRPTQEERLLRDVTLLKLETLRIPKGLVAVSVTAQSVPLPVTRQRDLFDTAGHLQPSEELTTLVNRVTGRLGKDSVLRIRTQPTSVPEDNIQLRPLVGSHIQENIQNLVHELVAPEGGVDLEHSIPGRPLWLFQTPVEVSVEDSPDAISVRIGGSSHSVIQCTGPERIQTQWWNDIPVHRDYFRMQLQEGGTAWVFRDLRTGTWWQHGWFE